MIAEYLDKGSLVARMGYYKEHTTEGSGEHYAYGVALREIRNAPAANVAPVVRCKDCKHSTLPSELTQRYGKPGTLTCHNMHAPSNRRNVGRNIFADTAEKRTAAKQTLLKPCRLSDVKTVCIGYPARTSAKAGNGARC